MPGLKIVTSNFKVYDLDHWGNTASVSFTSGNVQNINVYTIYATQPGDFDSNGNLVDKAGYSKHTSNGTSFYYTTQVVTVTATPGTHTSWNNLGYWNLGENLPGTNIGASIDFNFTDAQGNPVKLPMIPVINNVDGGVPGVAEKIVLSIHGGSRALSEADVSITKRDTAVSPSSSDLIGAWKGLSGAFSASGNTMTADYKPILNAHPTWHSVDTDTTFTEKEMESTGFKYDYTAYFGGQHAEVTMKALKPESPQVETVTPFEIDQKVNCGCVSKIGTGYAKADGTVMMSDVSLDGSLINPSSHLTGNIHTASSLGGLTTKSSNCSSPNKITGYEIVTCGVQVNVEKPQYVAKFVDEKGCYLYIPNAQDDKDPVCDKNDSRLNPPMPNGWEQVLDSNGNCANPQTCPKVAWVKTICGITEKQITIKPKRTTFTQTLDVNWFDQNVKRGNLGYITRQVTQNEVTGERVFSQWDNTNIHFDKCVPFRGLFEQTGTNHDGVWRDLMPDMNWKIIQEGVDCDNHQLKVNVMYTGLSCGHFGNCGCKFDTFGRVDNCLVDDSGCLQKQDGLYYSQAYRTSCDNRHCNACGRNVSQVSKNYDRSNCNVCGN